MTKKSIRKATPPPTPKQLRKSIILDKVNPTDFRTLNFTFCCEQCVHFAAPATCTFGFIAAHHLRDHQLKTYDRTGRVAFCRYLEID